MSPALGPALNTMQTDEAAWASPFRSFWMGGFEGADHVNTHGRPLDMVQASGHLDHLDRDYERLAAWGLRSVRESLGWRLCEPRGDGRFDFTRARRVAATARRHGIQVLWTLMHYGTPPGLSLFDPRLGERLARWARAAAQALGDADPAPPVFTPINEISFLAWAAAETRLLHPYGPADLADAGDSRRSGFELKCHLVRAALMAMQAISEVDPRARFLHVEPVVHVVAPADRPDLAGLAAEVRSYQWQTWDLYGSALDLIGVNHYHNGQWEVATEQRLHWHLQDPRRLPFSMLLGEVWQRYARPLIVAETSHIGVGRAAWLNEIAAEVQLARQQGVAAHGLCLYPIVDRPDWDHVGHWHHSGLWDTTDDPAHVGWPRVLNPAYGRALRRWQRRLPGP